MSIDKMSLTVFADMHPERGSGLAVLIARLYPQQSVHG
jgi:hypothetical protein